MATSAGASELGESSDPGPISPPTTTGHRRESVVWDYFHFDVSSGKSVCQVEVPGGGDVARVKCGTAIAGNFPMNLKAHLKSNHPVAHAEMVEKEAKKQKEKAANITKKKMPSLASTPPSGQLPLEGTIAQAQPYKKDKTRYKRITQTFVASANVANIITESEGFWDLLMELDPRYTVPTPTALDQEMESLLIKLKRRVAAKLQDSGKVAGLCTDIWSRKGITQSFPRCYCTKSDHKRCQATLAVRLLPSPHTAKAIEEAVLSVLQEWEIIEPRVSAILTDNGSNMIAAFKEWVLEVLKVDEPDEEKVTVRNLMPLPKSALTMTSE